MIPTASQLQTLRSRPHTTKLYLSIYQPTVVLAARVVDSGIAKGERLINYGGVTSGNFNLIKSGMRLYVGSTAGAWDKGNIRIRSATSLVLTVAENSDIDWADQDYLTVVSYFEIDAIFPRIIQDPGNETNTLWYKDYDVVYTDQNSVLGTFINMGSHYAGFLENGVCQVPYSASGTYNVRDDGLSYSWFFEGATVTGSTAKTPGLVSYTTPGHYTTRLTVDGTGTFSSDISYRHISIYDRPGAGTHPPILNWSLQSFSGSRDQGGWEAKIRIHETIPPSLLRDGSLIVIFADNWYGGVSQSVGTRGNIIFTGYILQGSIRYNYRESYVDFKVGSPSLVMKQAEGFSVSVQYDNDPSTATQDPVIPSPWVTVLDMNVKRALYHYLRWHSTVLMTNDFQCVFTDRPLQFFDTDRTSLYDAVHTAMKGILMGNLVCDRSGKIWAERDVYIEPSIFQTSFTLASGDWMGDVQIEENYTDKTAFIEMGGIAFFGNAYEALLTNAPGVAPGYRGGVERIQGLALVDQDELNEIAGDLLAQKNITYPGIDIQLAGNYSNFDIAPQEIIPLTLSATDTIRGITFSSKLFYLGRMEWQHDPEWETFLPHITLVEIASGVEGDTIYIPPIPDPGGFGQPDTTGTIPGIGGIEGGNFGFPPFDPPTWPQWPNIVSNSGGGFQTFIPILSALEDGASDVYPIYTNSGGIRIVNANVKFSYTMVVPALASSVVISLIYGTVSFTSMTGDVHHRATRLNTADILDSNFDLTAYEDHFSNVVWSGFPLGLSWSVPSDLVLLTGDYDFNVVGSMYIFGVYFDWG